MIKAPSSGMPRWASSIMTAMRRGSSPEGRRSSLGALQRDEIRAKKGACRHSAHYNAAFAWPSFVFARSPRSHVVSRTLWDSARGGPTLRCDWRHRCATSQATADGILAPEAKVAGTDDIRASLASAYNAGDRPPPICRLGRYGLGGSRPWISVGAEWPASNLRWRASSQYNHLEALATFLIKGAVVWYAAVRTQWQLCQGNMLLDAMVCLANHGHQHDLLVAPLFFLMKFQA